MLSSGPDPNTEMFFCGKKSSNTPSSSRKKFVQGNKLFYSCYQVFKNQDSLKLNLAKNSSSPSRSVFPILCVKVSKYFILIISFNLSRVFLGGEFKHGHISQGFPNPESLHDELVIKNVPTFETRLPCSWSWSRSWSCP